MTILHTDEAQAKMAELRERNQRIATTLSNKIALDIIDMMKEKHPGTHPGIISTALISSLASIVSLFANDPTAAAEAGDITCKQLKSTIMGMTASKRAAMAARDQAAADGKAN